MTREVRRGRPLPVEWDRKPRILFAFANPDGLAPVPAQEHLEALRRAVEPWVKWKEDLEERVKEAASLITVVPNASLKAIRKACESAEFTHVHILAHGGPFEQAGDRHYGVALCTENDASKTDIVDGERLALALTAAGPEWSACNRPTLLTLATCDSAKVGSVITPGGSIAHELHAAGIPWVIASQFPLYMRASSVATEVLYGGLLKGDDPRSVLYAMRQRLRTSSAGTHDWASIVAYASVPWDFERQVEAFRNRQRRTGLEVKFDKAEKLVALSRGEEEIELMYQSIRDDLAAWVGSLASSASKHERSERLGMSGASEKRMGILFDRKGDKDRARKAYVLALDHYRKALEADPLNHWVITQFLSLCAVVAGKDNYGSLAREYHDWWIATRQTALWQLKSASGEDKAWVYGTLAELEMLGVVYGGADFHKKGAKERIMEYCREILDITGGDSFPVFSTRRQFERYLDPWKRDEWKDLAQAAVKALGEAKSWVGRPYLGPGRTGS